MAQKREFISPDAMFERWGEILDFRGGIGARRIDRRVCRRCGVELMERANEVLRTIRGPGNSA